MADTSEHSELLAKFVGVTGIDADRAQFYLESAAWKLDVALEGFYGEGMEDDDDDPTILPAPTTGPSPPATSPPGPGSQSSKFATLSSLRDQEDSDSEEEGQAFYAGGHEKGGGQQVLGPPRKKADEIIQDMFNAAKEHGAEEVTPEEDVQGQKPRRQFGGTGYRLGDTEASSDRVYGGPSAQKPKQIDVVLKLWKNGFSVDNGALRDFKDPANKAFLDSIHQGEVPRELVRLAQGGEVNLNMEDHRTEEYVAPKVNLKPFTGEGYVLGSPAPHVQSNATPAVPAVDSSVIKVDESQPTTSLQIRLADGSRVVQKFNHSHTVCDIRSHITALRPQYQGANFVLMTTFPNKELDDESVTLKNANLLNAVLVQRMK